jgi:hypothetical protein
MRREQEDRIDPSKPALVVMCGTTRRKCRPLTSDLILLGRAPGCDIGLVSPEVSPVHCIIFRSGGAWRIRDCSGRATRVNGRTIQDELLCDSDVIQVGSFSFQAHLPACAAGAEVAPTADVERLQASRRRLADLALGLRRRLHEAQAAQTDLARREHDLEEMVGRLRAGGQGKPPQRDLAEQAAALSRLEQRKGELDHYSRHLRRLEQRLSEQEREQARQGEADRAGYEADLVRARVELEQEKRELAGVRAHLEQRHAELEQTATLLEDDLTRAREQLEQDREQLAGERAYLDQQRQELIEMRDQLERRQIESSPVPGLSSARETELDSTPDRLASARRLLRQLAERRQSLTPRPAAAE